MSFLKYNFKYQSIEIIILVFKSDWVFPKKNLHTSYSLIPKNIFTAQKVVTDKNEMLKMRSKYRSNSID